MISGGSIDNTTVTVDSIAGHTASTTGTVYGISVTSGAIQSNTAIKDGIILPKSLLTGTGSSWAWQSYTATTTGITETSGTKTASYIQIGKTVFFRFRFVLGASSAITGSPTITLPVTASSFWLNSQGGIIGSCNFVNAGVADYTGSLRSNSTTIAGLLSLGTAGINTAVSSSVPFSFGTADELTAQGFYEAA